MTRILLELPAAVHQSLLAHLLPRRHRFEEAAFVFARATARAQDTVFEYLEHQTVPPDGFASRHADYLELEDRFRASLIKRAHDLGASLAEFHSHTTPWPPAFSISDRTGLREFVPHVWWRLQGKPYLAVVVSRSGFDALAWLTDSHTPTHMDGLIVHRRLFMPSRLTLLQWTEFDERATVRPEHTVFWQAGSAADPRR